MRLWVIYYNPSDYPKKYVVRSFTVDPGVVAADLQPRAVCDSIQEARTKVPPNLCCIGRDADDEPQIVEVWL